MSGAQPVARRKSDTTANLQLVLARDWPARIDNQLAALLTGDRYDFEVCGRFDPKGLRPLRGDFELQRVDKSFKHFDMIMEVGHPAVGVSLQVGCGDGPRFDDVRCQRDCQHGRRIVDRKFSQHRSEIVEQGVIGVDIADAGRLLNVRQHSRLAIQVHLPFLDFGGKHVDWGTANASVWSTSQWPRSVRRCRPSMGVLRKTVIRPSWSAAQRVTRCDSSSRSETLLDVSPRGPCKPSCKRWPSDIERLASNCTSDVVRPKTNGERLLHSRAGLFRLSRQHPNRLAARNRVCGPRPRLDRSPGRGELGYVDRSRIFAGLNFRLQRRIDGDRQPTLCRPGAARFKTWQTQITYPRGVRHEERQVDDHLVRDRTSKFQLDSLRIAGNSVHGGDGRPFAERGQQSQPGIGEEANLLDTSAQDPVFEFRIDHGRARPHLDPNQFLDVEIGGGAFHSADNRPANRQSSRTPPGWLLVRLDPCAFAAGRAPSVVRSPAHRAETTDPSVAFAKAGIISSKPAVLASVCNRGFRSSSNRYRSAAKVLTSSASPASFHTSGIERPSSRARRIARASPSRGSGMRTVTLL